MSTRIRERLWPTAVALTLLALAGVFRNRPGVWVGDNRFELYTNPSQRVDRLGVIWDVTRGLGRIREEFWPAITFGIGAFRWVGFGIGHTMHFWHAALIALGGIGMVALLRFWYPRIGLAHWTAALLWMFGPFSVAFLLPSNLYVNYAVAPWLVLAVLRGVTNPTRWRWPAAIALTLAMVGNVDYAGTMFAVLFAAVAGVVHVIGDSRRSAGEAASDILRFGIRTVALVIPTNAAALYKTALAAEVFVQRVRDTETPNIISTASSWSESLRGLGSWLLYVVDASGPTRPQVAVYLTQNVAIIATFLVPIAAVTGLMIARRERAVLGALFLLGAVLMVGNYPIGDEPPLGELLAWARAEIPQLGALRNTFKAGSGLMMGAAALTGIVVARLAGDDGGHDRESVGRGRMVVTATAAVVFVAVLSQPFWRGPLYNPAWELEALPDHVSEFVDWMNDQDDDHRALVVPGSTRNGFRWGWVNDDYLDALVERPQVTNTVIELSRPIPADMLQMFDLALRSQPEPGLAGSVARRIGADLIVIRNDHRWEVWGQPPPADLDHIRNDPTLDLVATFGAPGEFTASGFDRSPEAVRARELPPIEVYAVRDARPVIDVRPMEDTAVVSGAGMALASLEAADVLDGRSVRWSAEMSAAQLSTTLAAGTPLIVTDTNRRAEAAITLSRRESWTLIEDEELVRPVIDLFGVEASETVADFGAAASVRSSQALLRFETDRRPGLAFDGLESTAWMTGVGRRGAAESLRLDFERPEQLGEVEIVAESIDGGAVPLTIEVIMSNGTTVDAEFVDGVARADLNAVDVIWVDFVIASIQGPRVGVTGLAEIRLAGVDVADGLRVPADVPVAAEGYTPLADALASADISWVFGAERSVTETPAELRMRRVFTVPADVEVGARGRVALHPEASDELLAAIGRSPVQASSGDRGGAGLDGWAGRAIDGDPATGWVGSASDDQHLGVTFPAQRIAALDVIVDQSATRSSVRALRIIASGPDGEREVTARFLPLLCEGRSGCTAATRVRLGDGDRSYTSLRIEPAEVERIGIEDRFTLPVSVLEVRPASGPFDGSEVLTDAAACAIDLLAIDGKSVPTRLVAGDLDLLLDGGTAEFETCAPVALAAGERDLRATVGATIQTLALTPVAVGDAVSPEQPGPDGRDPNEASGDVVSTERRLGWTIELPNTPEDAGGSYLTIGQSWDPRWTAELNGVDLGEPISVDTLAAWVLPDGASGTVEVRFPPQRLLDIAIIVSMVSWLVCGVLLGRRFE